MCVKIALGGAFSHRFTQEWLFIGEFITILLGYAPKSVDLGLYIGPGDPILASQMHFYAQEKNFFPLQGNSFLRHKSTHNCPQMH